MIAPRQTMFYTGHRIVGDRPDSARIPMQDECKRCGEPVTDRGKGKAFRYCQACREARTNATRTHRKGRPATMRHKPAPVDTGPPTEWDLPWLLRWQWEHTPGRTTA